ncbi:hypothetical protein ACQ4M4_27170 [Leptolyngbya sp. AN02str]|uniref:hypothetical protein n=1 Tax=Leptolyngbya sp. AN02str TaxID=3423363 RepID=UPI003D318288
MHSFSSSVLQDSQVDSGDRYANCFAAHPYVPALQPHLLQDLRIGVVCGVRSTPHTTPTHYIWWACVSPVLLKAGWEIYIHWQKSTVSTDAPSDRNEAR